MDLHMYIICIIIYVYCIYINITLERGAGLMMWPVYRVPRVETSRESRGVGSREQRAESREQAESQQPATS
jgi:hypothetical protein